MRAILQVHINDKELRGAGLAPDKVLNEALEVLADHFDKNYNFYFEIGYNPKQITFGEIS